MIHSTYFLLFIGDITPNSYPAKLFMGIMIIVALVVIPTQVVFQSPIFSITKIFKIIVTVGTFS
jgi:hypothetical protein